MREGRRPTPAEPKLTPLRRQYLDIKQQQPDAILLYRLGDFYEMFDEDAERAAAVLQIVLTSREFGKGNRVSMCGVPYHAAPTYIGRLIEAGLRVAVCDQVGEVGRGLVERKVTRVITPGTVVDEDWLQPEANNYLAVAVGDGDARGLAYADITTGDLAACEASREALARELARIGARETLTLGLPDGEIPTGVSQDDQAWLSDPAASREMLTRHFQVRDLEGLGLQGRPLATHAVGLLLRYVEDTDPSALHVLTGVHVYGTADYMELDAFTRRNLELETAGRDARREGSLLAVLDRTHTAMGARRLREQLTRPLVDRTRLETRLDRVQSLLDDPALRGRVQAALDRMGDLERLANRVVRRAVSASDVRHLASALDAVTDLRQQLDIDPPALTELRDALDPCAEARALIARAVTERGERIIRPGYSDELDRVLDSAAEAKGWIAGLERRERETTGLRGLKVGYNRVFGYYLEVGRAHSDEVPETYQRRQTLANAERYVTPELKEYESRVLGAEERIAELERTLFDEIVDRLGADGPSLQRTALALAALDVAASLAEVAERQGYVRPELNDGDSLEIEAGRHPVVELARHERFVPNDSFLDPAERQIAVLTGPNMAGKSTYLRQVALIVLMAQVGSFVPAARASIGIVDRIFTRVGAHDDLAAGASTFMVEMLELAAILAQATPRSLIVLDEIGRGTSTYDGISVARAVIEHLHNHPRLRARTIFATHYHELTAVADLLPRVHNLNASAIEQDGQVVFLRRITPGGADRSFGVHVAEMAGLPSTIIRRAAAILGDLETQSNGRPSPTQLSLLPPPEHPVLDDLRALDLEQLAPLDALTALYELQRHLRS